MIKTGKGRSYMSVSSVIHVLISKQKEEEQNVLI